MDRLVEYRLPDGTFTTNRAAAQVVSPALLILFCRANVDPRIPATYVVETFEHEADFVYNTRETEPTGHEPPGATRPQGLVTHGGAQITAAEGASVDTKLEELYDPLKAALAIVKLALLHLPRLQAAALAARDRGLPYVPGDMPAYLAYAHNDGMGEGQPTNGAIPTIQNFGLDWTRFEGRNPNMRIVRRPRDGRRYGRDCITGGPRWAMWQPVVKVLTKPPEGVQMREWLAKNRQS